MSSFSERLKAERKRLGLTQADLGTAGSVTKGAQLNYESGERSPSADYLQRIALVGVDVGYVLTGRRAPPVDLSHEQTVLLASFASSDELGRSALLAVASLASRPASKEGKNNTVKIAGDVGQSIAGDASFTAPVSFSVGKKKP